MIWAIVVAIWSACVTMCVISIVKVRKLRRKQRTILEHNERIADRVRRQEENYQEARRNLTIMNDQLAARIRRDMNVPLVTEESWDAAVVKARQRLLAALDEKQRREFEYNGFFHVTARESGTQYRLEGRSFVGNIYQENNWQDSEELRRVYGERPTRPPRWCMHLYNGYQYNYPMEDHLLAQALMIRNDEQEFRRIANAM